MFRCGFFPQLAAHFIISHTSILYSLPTPLTFCHLHLPTSFSNPLTGIMEQLSASYLYSLVVCVCVSFVKIQFAQPERIPSAPAVLPLLWPLHNFSCSEVVVLPLFLLPSSLPFTPSHCPLPSSIIIIINNNNINVLILPKLTSNLILQ